MHHAMHRNVGDVVEKASQGNERDDLKLLGDEFGHRLRKNDDEKEYLVHQDEAKWRIDRFQVVIVMPSVEERHVIEQEDKRKVTDKEDNSQPNNELFKLPSMLRRYHPYVEVGYSFRERLCYRHAPPFLKLVGATLA